MRSVLPASDETTISNHRGNGPLNPNGRYAYVMDEAGSGGVSRFR